MSMTISEFVVLFNSASYCVCSDWSCYVLRHDSSPANNYIMQSTNAPIEIRFSTTILCVNTSKAFILDNSGTLQDGWRPPPARAAPPNEDFEPEASRPEAEGVAFRLT